MGSFHYKVFLTLNKGFDNEKKHEQHFSTLEKAKYFYSGVSFCLSWLNQSWYELKIDWPKDLVHEDEQ